MAYPTCGRCVGRQRSRHRFFSGGHYVKSRRYADVIVVVIVGRWRRRRNAGYGRRFFSAGPRNTPLAETQSHKGSHRIQARIPRGRTISTNTLRNQRNNNDELYVALSE